MIDVIGTDAGAPASLPATQQALVRAAVHVAAPRRLHPSLQDWLSEDQRRTLIVSDDPRGLVTTLQALPADQAVVVLASGDPLWFGIGRILADRLPADRLRFHPAPTALQLAFARIGRPWQDASWVSLHGLYVELGLPGTHSLQSQELLLKRFNSRTWIGSERTMLSISFRIPVMNDSNEDAHLV